jgi:hypothetical protein
MPGKTATIFVEEPATVEVMVFGPDGETLNQDGEPEGYVSAELFLEMAETCSRLHSSPTAP